MRIKKLAILAACAGIVLIGCGKAQDAYEKGMKLAQEGKYEESLKSFQTAIQENQDRTEYYIGYGLALNHLSRYAEAETELKKALQGTKNKISEENNKQLYYGMAMAAYGLGEYESVVKYCDKALDIAYFEELDPDIQYTKIGALELKGDWKKAEKAEKELIRSDEKYMEAYMELAKTERRLGRNDEAEKAYQEAISVNEGYYEAYFGLYEQYRLEGKTEKANEILEQLVTIPSNKAKNLVVIGRAYYCQGNAAKAREYWKMAQDANSKECLYYLGLADLTEKSYQEAVQYFEEYVDKVKEDCEVMVYEKLAQAYTALFEYEKAQAAITKGLSYGTTDAVQSLKKSQVILYEKQNKYKKANQEAKAYLKIYPQDVQMQKELDFIQTRMK